MAEKREPSFEPADQLNIGGAERTEPSLAPGNTADPFNTPALNIGGADRTEPSLGTADPFSTPAPLLAQAAALSLNISSAERTESSFGTADPFSTAERTELAAGTTDPFDAPALTGSSFEPVVGATNPFSTPPPVWDLAEELERWLATHRLDFPNDGMALAIQDQLSRGGAHESARPKCISHLRIELDDFLSHIGKSWDASRVSVCRNALPPALFERPPPAPEHAPTDTPLPTASAKAASTAVGLQDAYPPLQLARNIRPATKCGEIYIDIFEGFRTDIATGAHGTTCSHYLAGEIIIRSKLKMEEPAFQLGYAFPHFSKFDFIFNTATEVKKEVDEGSRRGARSPQLILNFQHRPRNGKCSLVKYHSRDPDASWMAGSVPVVKAQWSSAGAGIYSVAVTLDATNWVARSKLGVKLVVTKIPLPDGATVMQKFRRRDCLSLAKDGTHLVWRIPHITSTAFSFEVKFRADGPAETVSSYFSSHHVAVQPKMEGIKSKPPSEGNVRYCKFWGGNATKWVRYTSDSCFRFPFTASG